MSRFVRFACVLLLVAIFSGCVAVSPDTDPGKGDVTASLLNHYPKIEYQEINPAPINGLYEVVLTDGEVIYFDPLSGDVVLGAIWTPDGHNLTQEGKDRRLAAKPMDFPLDKAIKIGDGPNRVIEITDPDCPFCRRSDKYFAGRTDLTRYIFLHPLTKIHPNSEAKARYILGAKNRAQAYEEVFSGKFDSKPVPAADDHGLLKIHIDVARRAGVKGTPHSWINGEHVAGFNPIKFDALLNKK